MADEVNGTGKPPETGGGENPEARKKAKAKKTTRKKAAPLAACKPAPQTTSTAPEPKPEPAATARPEAQPSRPAAPPETGGSSTYGTGSDSDNMRSGFLALWGPATMLIFVVLIFRFMGEGDVERSVSAQGATQALLSSGQESTSGGGAGNLTRPESTAESGSDLSSPGGIMDAIRSATPDQITAALEAARAAIKQTPKGSEGEDASPPADGMGVDSAAAPPPPGGFDNPWAPSGSEAWVTGAEPPPPPSGQWPYPAQQPVYPPTMPPQGYAQYGWPPMPGQGYGPPAQGQYPPQGYPTMPPQGAYPQQPYWGQQQPYGGQPPYGGQQPYPPPPPGY